MIEEWRPVVGYERRYEVSNQGRVRGVDRIVRNNAGEALRRGKMMKLLRDKNGRYSVMLSQNSVQTRHRTAVLVLEAFVGPRPPGLWACHNDGNLEDNSLANLRWDTPSSNTIDSVEHGTHPARRMDACTQGHEYDEENTRWYLRHGRPTRRCRRCANRAQVRNRAKKRAVNA